MREKECMHVDKEEGDAGMHVLQRRLLYHDTLTIATRKHGDRDAFSFIDDCARPQQRKQLNPQRKRQVQPFRTHQRLQNGADALEMPVRRAWPRGGDDRDDHWLESVASRGWASCVCVQGVQSLRRQGASDQGYAQERPGVPRSGLVSRGGVHSEGSLQLG